MRERPPLALPDLGTPGRDPETGEQMLLFYGGHFSQWCPVVFTVDGITYNCAEQYMMAQKARLFNDAEALKAIMASFSPSRQKAIGKTVKGFDKRTWEVVARDVVRTGTMAKFSLPEFSGALLLTGDATIVEASATDRIWGIGLDEYHPEAMQRSKWRGTNWLGDCLMDVRRALQWVNK